MSNMRVLTKLIIFVGLTNAEIIAKEFEAFAKFILHIGKLFDKLCYISIVYRKIYE